MDWTDKNDGDVIYANDINSIAHGVQDVADSAADANSAALAAQSAAEAAQSTADAALKEIPPATIGVLGGIKLLANGSTNRSGIVVGDDGTAYINANANYGITRSGDGKVMIAAASDTEVAAGTHEYKPITPKTLKAEIDRRGAELFYDIENVQNNVESVQDNVNSLAERANITYDFGDTYYDAREDLDYATPENEFPSATYGKFKLGDIISFKFTRYIDSNGDEKSATRSISFRTGYDMNYLDVFSSAGNLEVGCRYTAVITDEGSNGGSDTTAWVIAKAQSSAAGELILNDITKHGVYFGECTTPTATATKTVTISDLPEVVDGTRVAIRFAKMVTSLSDGVRLAITDATGKTTTAPMTLNGVDGLTTSTYGRDGVDVVIFEPRGGAIFVYDQLSGNWNIAMSPTVDRASYAFNAIPGGTLDTRIETLSDNATALAAALSVETSARQTADATKQDKQTITNISDTTYTLFPESNIEYRFGTVTSLSIEFPTLHPVEDYAALIHFSTGDTAPSISYDDIKLKGDDVTVETDSNGSYYLFSPQPNTRYSIGLEYDGTYIMGYVSGTELI